MSGSDQINGNPSEEALREDFTNFEAQHDKTGKNESNMKIETGANKDLVASNGSQEKQHNAIKGKKEKITKDIHDKDQIQNEDIKDVAKKNKKNSNQEIIKEGETKVFRNKVDNDMNANQDKEKIPHNNSESKYEVSDNNANNYQLYF